jgi:hypothetical protein
VFSTGEAPTTAKLNRLAMPTIRISGTVGGTNAGITAGSITTTMLSPDVVDDVTIFFNGAAEFAIKPYSVGTNVVSTNLAGFPLIGGGGSPLSLTYNTNIFGVSSGTNVNNSGTNALGLADGFALQLSNVFWAATNVFVSTNCNITTGNMADIPHNLGASVTNLAGGYTNAPLGWVPRSVRWVLVAAPGENDYFAGEEVPVESVVGYDSFSGTSVYMPIFTGGASTTNVFLTYAPSPNGVGNYTPKIIVRGDNTKATFTPANWRAKCYAKP